MKLREAQVVCQCQKCNYEIFEGENYLEYDNIVLCDSCMNSTKQKQEHYCEKCNADISQDDIYLSFDDVALCENCILDEMNVAQIDTDVEYDCEW